jgi:hypothetical protein
MFRMEVGFGLFVIAGIFGYGFFLVVWPDLARRQFLSYYDLNAPMKWNRPRTWLKFKPGDFAFRIVGFVFIALSMYLLYASKDSP